MKRFDWRILWGILLVLGGIVFLMDSFNVINLAFFFNRLAPLLWVFIFAVPGVGFLLYFLSSRSDWWAAIPGFTLLGLSFLIGYETIFPRAAGDLGAAVFLGSIGLSFLTIYITTGTEQWWALIPAGSLFSIAMTVIADSIFREGDLAGAVFMLGMGATFGAVYLLPTSEGRQHWAIYPAGVMLVIGFFIMVSAAQFLGYIWPLALIGLGAYLIYRYLRPA